MTHPPPESRRAGDACDRIPTPKAKPASEPNRSTDNRPSVRAQVAASARNAGVSERMIWMALDVERNGIPELFRLVLDGRLALHDARKIARLPAEEQKALVLRIAAGERVRIRSAANSAARDRYGVLVRAWNRCTDDERVRFYEAITADD